MTRHVLSGTAAARGSALGRARVRLPHALDVAEARIAADEVDAELERIHAAVETVRAEMRTLRERLPDTTLIIDAGIGSPSHAAQAMEMGFDAVLLNSAVSQAADPVGMARAFKLSVEAGRLARQSGVMSRQDFAVATTPVTGNPFLLD